MATTGASFLRRALNPAALLEGFQRGNPGRAQRALYAGRGIGFGNQVSFSEHKYAPAAGTGHPGVFCKRSVRAMGGRSGTAGAACCHALLPEFVREGWCWLEWRGRTCRVFSLRVLLRASRSNQTDAPSDRARCCVGWSSARMSGEAALPHSQLLPAYLCFSRL